MRPTKRCAQCGGLYDAEAFFRRDHAAYIHAASGSRSICIRCEQTNRDAAKVKDRWPTKVRDTVRRHAQRLKIEAGVLRDQYGWSFDRLLHDAKHAYANSCFYCNHAFAEMGHGLFDITLDIVNPESEPYYTTNVRWVCASCNREKSRLPAALWGARLACQDIWNRLPRRRIPVQPSLFNEDDE